MTELMGQTQTATYTYMTAPKLNGLSTNGFLPTIGNVTAPGFKPYDTYPAPTPLRRSLTSLPWRPGTYYGTARVDSSIPHAYSMPEPLSDRTKLAELDSFKVICNRSTSLMIFCHHTCNCFNPDFPEVGVRYFHFLSGS
jgi:hypothetical protein